MARRYVVPELLRLLASRDFRVRTVLLECVPQFSQAFSKQVAKRVGCARLSRAGQELLARVVPEVLAGTEDSSDEMLAATLHAMAALVLHCGGAFVNPKLHRRSVFHASLQVRRSAGVSRADGSEAASLPCSHCA